MTIVVAISARGRSKGSFVVTVSCYLAGHVCGNLVVGLVRVRYSVIPFCRRGQGKSRYFFRLVARTYVNPTQTPGPEKRDIYMHQFLQFVLILTRHQALKQQSYGGGLRTGKSVDHRAQTQCINLCIPENIPACCYM